MQPIAPRQPSPPPSSSALPKSIKRKRSDETPDESGPDSSTPQPRKARDGPKKKKANRACYHCQKAHLTCDDSRPCQRCTKRGIAATCTEGHRKKAKYLLDDDELEALKRQKAAPTAPPPDRSSAPADSPIAPAPDSFAQPDPTFSVTFDPNFPFGSEAANLEYSILSAILGNPSPPESSKTPPPPPSYSTWPSTTEALQFSQSPGSYASLADNTLSIASDTGLSTSPSSTFLTYPYHEPPKTSELPELQYPQPFQPQSQQNGDAVSLHPLQPRYPLDARPRSPPLSGLFDSGSNGHGLLSPPHTNDSPASSTVSCVSKLQSINDRVTKPYDYTEGYHFLMKHLPTRFEKNDILRIVRALAIFRPSLIALQMPLSLDDEVFVEKCFQRSLLELEKLISFSGTPTVVWRRTGEICLVAPEFCMLTEWSMEELVGRKKYIYELFENQSVVEYWENFASHAFENTTQSVYSHCVLLKPSGAPVPSTFCFSIRRDLFDLPSVVIGQWLPLL